MESDALEPYNRVINESQGVLPQLAVSVCVCVSVCLCFCVSVSLTRLCGGCYLLSVYTITIEYTLPAKILLVLRLFGKNRDYGFS